MIRSTITKDTEYSVKYVDIQSIQPSPENDDIYGVVEHDDQMQSLILSIHLRGLAEPIIVSSDGYIVSGHRRYFAVKWLGLQQIPVRIAPFSRANLLAEWHQVLAEYNPQRIKSALALLKEKMLLRSDDDPRGLLVGYEQASLQTDADYTEVTGFKKRGVISSQRVPFLIAAVKVIKNMRKYWPLTVRQIHYQLLNDPPLKRTAKTPSEEERYRNDDKSYKALVRLLTDARYSGEVPLRAIDDPTRPFHHRSGYDNLSQFINQEMEGFLTGYERNRQVNQPRHIQVLGEKNTLLQIIRPVCDEYQVPFTVSRGYGGIALWKQISDVYQASRKKRMSLIVVSDYDPEGLDLPKDAVRSLRDHFGIEVDYHRVAVKRDQIESLNLAQDFNPAKPDSTRLKAFIKETGGTETWECEAIPPDYLQEQLRAAIEANMDLDLYRECEAMEYQEADELYAIRKQIVEGISL